MGLCPNDDGLVLILIGLSILLVKIGSNQFSAYRLRKSIQFLYVQVPIIAYSIVAGTFVAVIGVAILRKITNKLSYASIVGGFTYLIMFTDYLLIG